MRSSLALILALQASFYANAGKETRGSIVLLVNCILTNNFSVDIAYFQEDGLFSKDTYLEYDSSSAFSDLEDLSWCLWFKVYHLRSAFTNLFSCYNDGGQGNVLSAGGTSTLFSQIKSPF